jgi:hypothetical protein
MQYSQPNALPAGYLEVLQPLTEWLMRQLVAAYDDGYSAGRADERLLSIRAVRLSTK